MPFLQKYLTILFLLFFITSVPAEVPTYDKQWLNLYRYQNGKSLVNNKNWFFHKNGQTSPDEEFKAGVDTLRESSEKRCQFPARTLYLQRKGFLNKEYQDNCQAFEYFKRKVKLENVWLVFASYYVNNPSSAFGHTLFKLQGKGHGNDLLEWGVNFAAQMTTQNPFLYALFGLTGGFQGNFSLLPYFIKIAEYSDSETRDLWEYQLDLTEEEKELFLAHLWEMDGATFDYYYLTQNCSYHLLLFLDAIRPSFKFQERMSYFVLPSHTLTIADQTSGLIRASKVRPSQFKRTQARYKMLSDNTKKFAFKLQEQAYNLDSREKADLLDFQIDYMDLTQGKLLLQKDSKAIKQKRELQGRRSKLGDLPPKNLEFKEEVGPHAIHPSRFLGLGYENETLAAAGRDPQFKRILFSYRFSFHEYLDPQKGAPSWSQLMLGKVEGAYETQRERLELKNFTLFTTEANQENIMNTAALSWGMTTGLRNHPYTEAYDLGPYLKTIVGLNWRTSWGLYRLVTPIEIDYSRPSTEGKELKYAGKLLGQVMGTLGSHMRLIASLGPLWANYRQRSSDPSVLFFGELQGQFDLSSQLSLRFQLTALDKDLQNQAKLLFYF